jgi:hypothetical protein
MCVMLAVLAYTVYWRVLALCANFQSAIAR